MRTTLLTAACTVTVLATTGIALGLRRSTSTTTPTPAAVPEATEPTSQKELGPYGPRVFGGEVEQLHDWLASGTWSDPTEVLEALREQAPAYFLADLVRDLTADLSAAGHREEADRLGEAERLLCQAAAVLGERDYDEDGSTCPDEPHDADCVGGCGGTGMVLEIMTWDDQGDGIYVPVHQEPVDCPAGRTHYAHGQDCGCGGSGFTFEGGYRHLCLGTTPPQPYSPTDEDPWDGVVKATPDDCPF
ncbi:hypothetical protein [Kitasatospora sp. NBC_01302]|uniref:hypothetical protein n=1 Tax=Kitasatospora sp. NBC_01302 TaxID=2903575 RepID=UPI002E111D7B|nr:hypothetical protein OG294_40135 [Kitasatospora sp. NBC_01302]